MCVSGWVQVEMWNYYSTHQSEETNKNALNDLILIYIKKFKHHTSSIEAK